MPYVCSECGQEHDELPRYFLRHAPRLRAWEQRRLRWDDRFTCRVPGRRFFISCELEVPFRSFPDERPLGFIGWVEVNRETYDWYRRFRRREYFLPRYTTQIKGRLANPVANVPRSLWTPVRLRVLRGDPTPYITWVPPRSTVAERVRVGVTSDFWHEVAGLVETPA